MKRLLALLLLVPLAHLTVARADVACAKHEADVSTNVESDVAADVTADVHAGHHADHSIPAAPEQDCEVPAQNECCEALASCGPAIGCLGATTAAVMLVADDANLTYARTMHASAIAAPEPPPPRV